MSTHPGTTTITTLLRARLLELARHQEELAVDEAATTPYWMPHPDTVHAHRVAADALRAEADRLLAAS